MGAPGRIWLNDKAPGVAAAVVVQDFEALPGYSGQFCPEVVSTAFRSRKEIAPVWIAHGQSPGEGVASAKEGAIRPAGRR